RPASRGIGGGARMHPVPATKTSADHLPALLRRQFARRNRRCSGLLCGNRQIAAVSRFGQAPHHECVAIRQCRKESWNSMKPCSNKRKLVALLAADALNANEERELRDHLETCEGCRTYLQEISNVTQKLGSVEIR